MKQIQRWVALLVFMVILGTCSAVPVFAASSDVEASHIKSIDVTVDLQENGDALITEVWDVDAPDDWSELYTTKTNLGWMEVEDFAVKNLTTGVDYTFDDSYELRSRTMEEIGNYCGIYTWDYERGFKAHLFLGWGATQPGRQKYQISYKMTGVVRSYTDGYDGFNIRFINSDMTDVPEHVRVTILSSKIGPFTSENTRFWAFGLQGTATLEDGAVCVKSDEDGIVNYCNVLMRFDDGIFSPEHSQGSSFYEAVKKAFKDSSYSIKAYQDDTTGGSSATSYEEHSAAYAWVIFGVIVAIIVTIGVAIERSVKKKEKTSATGEAKLIDASNITKEEKKETLYYRELPLGGNLSEGYLALDAMEELPEKTSIINAYLLKWMKHGFIRIVEWPEKTLEGKFADTKLPSVQFLVEKSDYNMRKPEQQLWRILREAAGNDDILQQTELSEWSYLHVDETAGFFRACFEDGYLAAQKNQDISSVVKETRFSTILKVEPTEKGRERFLQLLGFRAFLKDFTILNERIPRDVGLWGDYLVYAGLFGIADEVAKQFEELLPDFFKNTGKYGYQSSWTELTLLSTLHTMDDFSGVLLHNYGDAISSMDVGTWTASAGLGGDTSLGGGEGFEGGFGGGGFSGGGFGGGGR